MKNVCVAFRLKMEEFFKSNPQRDVQTQKLVLLPRDFRPSSAASVRIKLTDRRVDVPIGVQQAPSTIDIDEIRKYGHCSQNKTKKNQLSVK